MKKIYDRSMPKGRKTKIVTLIIIEIIMGIICTLSKNDDKDLFFLILLEFFLLTLYLISYLKRRLYSLNNNYISIAFGKQRINYSELKTIVVVLYKNTDRYSSISGHYIAYKLNGGIIYTANIFLYLTNNVKIDIKYNNIYDGMIVDKDFYNSKKIRSIKNTILKNECIYDFVSINLIQLQKILKYSPAKIYVSCSYLYFNNWTINEFARRINVDIDRICLIKDDPSGYTDKYLKKR